MITVAGNPLRILVVDDHAVVCGALEAMLSSVSHVATASDGSEALHLCATFDPHIVLLDLRMPGLDGYGMLPLLASRWPQIRVVILTSSAHSAAATLARKLGAAGFVLKSDPPASLLGALRAVADGGTHFPEAASEAAETPTARELEVLFPLARGLTNEEIGLVLGISAQTVKGHVKSLFLKLQAANRAEAVARAHELGLL